MLLGQWKSNQLAQHLCCSTARLMPKEACSPGQGPQIADEALQPQLQPPEAFYDMAGLVGVLRP